MNDDIDLDTFIPMLATQITTLAAGRTLTFPYEANTPGKKAAHVQALAAEVVRGMGLNPSYAPIVDEQGHPLR